MSSLAGGVLGGLSGRAVSGLLGTGWNYVVSGAVQGLVVGAGTGLATGFAGGRGSAEQMLTAAGLGAAWGAALGAVLGFASYKLAGTPPVDPATGKELSPALQVGNILNKYDPDPAVQGVHLVDQVGAVDNQLGLGYDIGQAAATRGSTAGGFVFDFIGTGWVPDGTKLFWAQGSLFNIPLGWLPAAAYSGGFLGAVVTVLFAADEMGYSYADQIMLLAKGAPYFIDFAATVWLDTNPGGNSAYNWYYNGVNKLESQ